VARKLKEEIKQRRPFAGPEEEVYLNVMRTADALTRATEQVLKGAGLSPNQYNVLRILRGAGKEGLRCREVGERMLTRDPDITRLLDRLEARGLVTRERQRGDRRVVTSRITDAGLKLLAGLDTPVREQQRRLLGHLARAQLRHLSGLLEAARARVP
jgi:DNA-binding MarR family transcriptional regulator